MIKENYPNLSVKENTPVNANANAHVNKPSHKSNRNSNNPKSKSVNSMIEKAKQKFRYSPSI